MWYCILQVFSIQNKSSFLFADIEMRDRDININSAIVKRENYKCYKNNCYKNKTVK